MTAVVLISVLTCPACGHADTLAMPTDACLFFHECDGCHRLLRPKTGDCCVFCSFGSVPCPPIQAGGACGTPDAEEDCCSAKRPAVGAGTANAEVDA